MYTILMKPDKSLITTNKTPILQGEKLADKIRVLVPQLYEEIRLNQCFVVIKYVDQTNTAHVEELKLQDELYKDHLQYFFNINSNLSRYAGSIKLKLSFLNVNDETGESKEVLHTGETYIRVLPSDEYSENTSDESLEVYDTKITELRNELKSDINQVSEYSKTKADTISYENNVLQLMSDGEKIGDAKHLDQRTEMDLIDID